MINGSVVVVVILQEIARVDQHLGHVFIAQRIRALQVGYQMPRTFRYVKIVN
jgi:hypothetical protein